MLRVARIVVGLDANVDSPRVTEWLQAVRPNTLIHAIWNTGARESERTATIWPMPSSGKLEARFAPIINQILDEVEAGQNIWGFGVVNRLAEPLDKANDLSEANDILPTKDCLKVRDQAKHCVVFAYRLLAEMLQIDPKDFDRLQLGASYHVSEKNLQAAYSKLIESNLYTAKLRYEIKQKVKKDENGQLKMTEALNRNVVKSILEKGLGLKFVKVAGKKSNNNAVDLIVITCGDTYRPLSILSNLRFDLGEGGDDLDLEVHCFDGHKKSTLFHASKFDQIVTLLDGARAVDLRPECAGLVADFFGIEGPKVVDEFKHLIIHGEGLVVFPRYNYQFEGTGQRPTSVTCARGLGTIINLLPGKRAAQFRLKCADVVVRYFGGDETLVGEIRLNREAQSQLPKEHPSRVFGEIVEAEGKKADPEELDLMKKIKRQKLETERQKLENKRERLENELAAENVTFGLWLSVTTQTHKSKRRSPIQWVRDACQSKSTIN
ncbi:hypothetical protein KFL_011570020 [Klebsormidium nitens]|uniref:Uncharacterized protein n=1 Tax=Klebsormidium nitens TaxID=105231 RepID=A0A1Y1IQ49_KLENI|nr:hypothetical protein KFL_011570020 [Klebsormidium nitens]|eukprot:GAQ92824.1 hypothetical protein KFL_011570020 [Klebsormidium nitens]